MVELKGHADLQSITKDQLVVTVGHQTYPPQKLAVSAEKIGFYINPVTIGPVSVTLTQPGLWIQKGELTCKIPDVVHCS